MTNKINLNISQITELPTPQELIHEIPLLPAQAEFIKRTRHEIVQILTQQDSRRILIVGPCSIHDLKAAKEYALRLKELSQSIADTFLLVMRVYFEKPRTSIGWKGLLYDPHLDCSNAIHTGLRWTRQLLIDLTDLGLPTAAEFLDPSSLNYFGDIVSWGCIGARTSESQTHRQIASGLPMPIAFKNNTDGNVAIAINGILAASTPHTFIGINDMGRVAQVQTKGNPHCHVALRGGEGQPNYDARSISQALEALRLAGLPECVIVDCSHDNSNRKHEQQIHVFKSIIHQIMEGEQRIRGLVLESHLNAGHQPFAGHPSKLKYAVSLTDPCLDWTMTERLIKWGHEILTKKTIPARDYKEESYAVRPI